MQTHDFLMLLLHMKRVQVGDHVVTFNMKQRQEIRNGNQNIFHGLRAIDMDLS